MIHKPYKLLVLLAILCATFLHLSLLFQSDLVAIRTIYVSATIFVYPFTCITLDIIAEVYGYRFAKQTLWATVVANLIFGLLAALSAKLPSPSFWTHYDKAYDYAMSPMFRTVFVGLGSIIIGQFINIYIITKLRVLIQGRFFALRSIASSMVGDTLTVVIALTLNFLARMPAGNIATIIVSELLFMYTFAILLSLPANMLTHWLKKSEPALTGVDFNPFIKRASEQKCSSTEG